MYSISNKINILIVLDSAGKGGVEKSIQTLCRYIDQKAFNLTVALPAEGHLKQLIDDCGIKTYVISADSWTPIAFHFGERHFYQFLSGMKNRVSDLIEIIEKENIQIVHSATLSIADGAFAAKAAGVPHIWHIHGKSVGTTDAYGTYLSLKTLYELVNELSDEIVAVSKSVKVFLESYLPGYDGPIIYNGIDFEEIATPKDSTLKIRNEFNLHDKKIVTLVGRIAKVKGIDDYVDSAIVVLSKRDDVAFLVVGEDEEKELSIKIKGRIEALKLSNRIIFLGKRGDIPQILNETDVFVCSSKTEGFPYSMLEAMAASLPIVTTKCGGPEELVIDDVTGFQVPVGQPEELAKAAIRILDDRELAQKMGRQARILVEQQFGAKAFAHNFEKIYVRLAAAELKKEVNPWAGVALELASTVGRLGTKTIQLEHDIRDLKSFESIFKDNFIYRGMKRLFKR